MTEEKRFYTYELAYPDDYGFEDGIDLSGVVFYVGKGTGRRMLAHEDAVRYSVGKTTNPYKDAIIRKILNKGLEVKKTKIASFDDEDEAFKHEKECIAFYGIDNLTNINAGGGGSNSYLVIPIDKDFLREIETFLVSSSEIADGADVGYRTVYRMINVGLAAPVIIQKVNDFLSKRLNFFIDIEKGVGREEIERATNQVLERRMFRSKYTSKLKKVNWESVDEDTFQQLVTLLDKLG